MSVRTRIKTFPAISLVTSSPVTKYIHVFDLHSPSLTRLWVDSLLVCCLFWWYDFPRCFEGCVRGEAQFLMLQAGECWGLLDCGFTYFFGWFLRSRKYMYEMLNHLDSVIDFIFVKEKPTFNFRYFLKSWFASVAWYDGRNESWIAEKSNVVSPLFTYRVQYRQAAIAPTGNCIFKKEKQASNVHVWMFVEQIFQTDSKKSANLARTSIFIFQYILKPPSIPSATWTLSISHRIHGTGTFAYMNIWFLW